MVLMCGIKIDKELKDFLKSKKVHDREPYNDVLRRLLNLNMPSQRTNSERGFKK